MKKFSIEEKAKAYDKAIEYAHYLINERCKEETDGSFHLADLQKMFPTLKESEDEKIRRIIIATIHLYYGEPLEDEAKEMISWIKKQGEKVTKGNEREIPNSTWGEDDENMLNLTCGLLNYNLQCRNWLKSLKERYIWKPSDYQIEALESATENCAYSEYQDCLRELIGQLKKLREE